MPLVQRHQVLIPGTWIYYHMYRKILTAVTKLKILTWGDYPGLAECHKNPTALFLQVTVRKVCHTQRRQPGKDRSQDRMVPHKPREMGTTRNGSKKKKKENLTYILHRDLSLPSRLREWEAVTEAWSPDLWDNKSVSVSHQVEGNLLQQTQI